MKIYTKTGDKGDTALFGGGKVRKDHKRIQAYGTVDELNAVLGIAISEITAVDISYALRRIQSQLFSLGADLATPEDNTLKGYTPERTSLEPVEEFERLIDSFSNELEPLKNFILPGGSKGSAALHLARTVCRRAERHCVELAGIEQINGNIVIFLNRLSDLLFILARVENKRAGIPDVIWEK